LRDHLLDRIEDIRLDQAGIDQRLINQCVDRILDFGRSSLGAWLEALLQQCREVIGIASFNLRLFAGAGSFCRHNDDLQM